MNRLLSRWIVCAFVALIVVAPFSAGDVEEGAPVTPFVFDGDVRNLPA